MEIVLVVICASMLVVSLLFLFGVLKVGNNTSKDSAKKPASSSSQCKPSTIKPAPFKTGFIENSPQHSASVCYGNDNAVRYPINLPFVDYGSPGISDDCACTEFIKAP